MFIILIFAMFYAFADVDFSLLKGEQYQDIIVNGQNIKAGVRVCENRYKLIEELIFKNYKRSFTLLDLGSAQGYFSLKAAYQYNATCVMVEGNSDYVSFLKYLSEKNTKIDSLILLDQFINLDFLESLVKCEHFDVVLALNIIHHLGEDWKEAIDNIILMGEHIIIETPSGEDKGACGQFKKEIEDYINTLGAKLIGKFERHTDSENKGSLYYLTKRKLKINQKYLLDFYNIGPKNFYYIYSDWNVKKFIKMDTAGNILVERDWLNGINFVTFKKFNGCVPNSKEIELSIKNIFNKEHHDFMPWNLIVSGSKVNLIDGEDAAYVDSSFGLNICLDFNLIDSKDIVTYLKQNIPWLRKQNVLKLNNRFGFRFNLDPSHDQ
jgi:hypothetical protein